ncbi:MAG: glutathione S-transferase [Parvibaculum sp.]|uniref:glutathione S-transferase family protein n=1 Tax=Parvibaculum sp. TaxID=2024848 RepID=UPI00271778DB|nr:glutathione S-transferase [Parvibaculum sp.]MDO8838624.1 glutathione S-transferase [Parvibaculum sp.]
MSVVLYDFTLAPSPRRARILLAEKDIAHETVQIDLMKAEQLGDAYRAINPSCTVPALKLESGTVLTENIGIAAWADAVKPEPALLGSTPEEKGLVLSWNARIEFEGFMPIAEVLRNTSKGMVGRALPGPLDLPQIPELAERGALRLTRFFDMLNARLKGRDFIAIDRYSFADITALVCVDFAKWVKHEPKPEHADLLRWHAAASARPSAKA